MQMEHGCEHVVLLSTCMVITCKHNLNMFIYMHYLCRCYAFICLVQPDQCLPSSCSMH